MENKKDYPKFVPLLKDMRGRKSPLLLNMIGISLVENLVNERIQELNNGLFIVDLTISNTNIIRVELDKMEGGVTVNDCVSVSRNVEHNLDREEQDFELHVSSAGLDKPLRHALQYKKNVGRMLSILTTKNESLEGKLLEQDGNGITIEIVKKSKDSKNKTISITESILISNENIKEAKVVISFK